MPILLETFVRRIWQGHPDHALPGSRTAAPHSLQATLSFNGIKLNDRTVVDRYRIIQIDGFQGPSIRNAMEPNPGDHGSTPLDNTLGERTMLITGKIVAHNMDKLEDMQMALRTAFYSMTEKPLIVSVADINRDVEIMARMTDKLGMVDKQDNDRFERDFQITLVATDPIWRSRMRRQYAIDFGLYDPFDTLSNWALDAGTDPDLDAPGVVAPTGDIVILRAMNYRPTDSRVTMKIETGASVANSESVGVVAKYIALSDHIWARVLINGASSRVQIYKRVGGVDTQLAQSATFTLAANTDYWLRYEQTGNVITCTLYSGSDPNDGAATTVATTNYTLTAGAEQNLFGTGMSGPIGIETDAAAGVKLNDFRVEPLTLDHQVFEATSLGNWMSPPIIRVYGPMANVTITNHTLMRDETFERSIKINGSIPAGNYYEFDSKAGSLVDKDGVDKFTQLDNTSRSILLEGLENGPNKISIEASGLSGITPRLMFTFNHTWI